MTFNSFLIFGVIFVFILCMITWYHRNLFQNEQKAKWIYLGAFVILGFFAAWMVNTYLYPTSTTVYDNTDYHILEHTGFRFNNRLNLVSPNPPEGHPNSSFWDGKTGKIDLLRDNNQFVIKIKEYYEPFFVSKKNEKGNYFTAMNNLIDANISQGFELKQNDSTIFKLKIVPYDDYKKAYYISSSDNKLQGDTSLFQQPINIGYPLMDILLRTPNLKLSEDLQQIFEDAVLVRQNILIDDWKSARLYKGKNDSPLRLFPRESFFSESGLSVNDIAITDSIDERVFTDTLSSGFRFYSGAGLSKTDIFTVSTTDSNGVMMKYVLPKMQKLRKEAEQKADNGKAKIFDMFLTSSIEEVTNSKMKEGYLYNLFENDNNFYHFNARIRYSKGTPKDSMFFKVTDLESVNPSDTIIKRANEEFSFQTKSNLNNFQWLFKVEDMRATNNLGWEHIFWFICSFILLVCVRMIFSKSISVLELSIYVVALCFAVIRLILTWRMSTFPPTEDIDPTVFNRLRDGFGEAKWTYLICTLPLLFGLIGYWKEISNFWEERIKNRLPDFKNWNFIKKSSIKLDGIKNWYYDNQEKPFFFYFWWIISLYIVTLLICLLLSKANVAPRFMNIPIPVFLFFLFNNWLKNKHQEADSDSLLKKVQKILLGILTLGYLALQDPGFAIIFLLYLALHFGLVALWHNTNREWKKMYILNKEIEIEKIGWSILFVIVTIGLLFYEGTILLFIFEKTGWFLLIMGFLLALFAVYIKKYAKTDLENHKKWIFRIVLSLGAILFVGGGFDVGLDHFKVRKPLISNYLNERKGYIKYRAKAQQPNTTISDMLLESDFNSNDVEYIMRSEHNQWFINEYNAAADNNKGYWTIQPHFNQGSTYTTQTTDLVIIRYVLAEHGVMVLIWLMSLLLLLLIIYAFDVQLEKTESFTILGVFILLFSTALYVCLSANNKIVFIGQDFPFLSLTSKIAVFFPVALFAMAVWLRIFHSDDDYKDEESIQVGKWGMVASLFVFAVVAVLCLPSKGKSTSEENDIHRFDVSALINEIAYKAADLDRELQEYQYTLDKVDKIPRDTIWRNYIERGEKWKKLANNDGKFFSSLLEHFNRSTTNKYDPEELLHLRLRNGYLHLAVNRRYYFIRSFREKDLQWTGDLKAAKTNKILNFLTNGKKTEDNYKEDIIPNIFKHEKVTFYDKVSNLTLMRLDSSWTVDRTPIYLISGEQGKIFHQYYDIVAEDYSKTGSAVISQLSVRLLPNDLMTLKRKDGNNESVIATWKYGETDERFLTKNIWLNGKQRLFYPLGRQSMWTFHFANLVNQTYGKAGNEQFKDSTIRISIDYDLTSQLYNIAKKDNETKSKINNKTEEKLLSFKNLSFNEKRNAKNISVFYFDINDKKVHIKANNYKNKKDWEKGVAYLNKKLGNSIKNISEAEIVNAKINEAIDLTIEKQYDYSAVILDGNGRIRALFDYSHLSKPDPNNIRNFNRFLSDMYKESSIRSEIDYLGNKSLQLLVPGPGSSFKPIAYTAVTSQAKISWNDLDLSSVQPNPKKTHKRDTKPKVAYYGGLDFDKLKNQSYWDLSYGSGLNHNDYLIQSNNLYHSIVILLGSQTRETLEGNFEGLFKLAGNDALSFPVIKYRGKSLSFNPNKWYGENYIKEYFEVGKDNAVLNRGLEYNFHLNPNTVEDSVLYNGFGNENYLSILYNNKRSYNFGWTYPIVGSMYNADRNEQPFIRNGLIQMSLGANPLEISPLQMATFGMRLASLNRTENLTTLYDDAKYPEYKLFDFNNAWDSAAYVSFYTDQVLGQLRQVPLRGTAGPDKYGNQNLKPLAQSMAKQGYYLYAKTGTLNITDEGEERLKHLLVIISNTQLEKIQSVAQLQKVKYYVLYLSFYGIRTVEFSREGFDNYRQVIEATIKSEQFIKYMNGK